MKRNWNLFFCMLTIFGLLFSSNSMIAVNADNPENDPPPEPNIIPNKGPVNTNNSSTDISDKCTTCGLEISSESSKTIDFEPLSNYDAVDDYYGDLGVYFLGAVVLSQGENLNYEHYPPYSGVNVIYDDEYYTDPGKITVLFDSAVTGYVTKVGGYVTGMFNVTMTAYDDDGSVLDSVETGGANYYPVGTPNMKLEITSTTNIAKVIFYNGGERANSYTVDDFFFSSEQSCITSGTPLFKQSNSSWGDDHYGGSIDKDWIDPYRGGVALVKDWGCALTSAAMVVAYHELQQKGSITVTPGDLNDWLRRNGGYLGGIIQWDRVPGYAESKGITLYHLGRKFQTNDGIINNSLCIRWPMILHTEASPYGSHFVVATGQTGNEWSINDPGGHNLTKLSPSSYSGYSSYGDKDTNLASLSIRAVFNNGVTAQTVASRESTPRSIEFLITDPAGRKVGFDPSTGTYVNELLASDYYIERIGDSNSDTIIEALVIDLKYPLSGQYNLEIIGSNFGSFDIRFSAYDESNNHSNMNYSGFIYDNTIIDAVINYSDTEGSEIDVDVLNPPPPPLNIYLPIVLN